MVTFIFSGKSAAQAWLCSYSLPLLGMMSDGCLEDQVNSEVSWNQLRVYLLLSLVLVL